MKKYLAFVLILLFALTIFAGCSKKEDDTRSTTAEQADADRLVSDLVAMVLDIGNYNGYVGGDGGTFRGPPPLWSGPDQFTTPDGNTADWYWWEFPFTDTTGAADTLLYLLMQTPDRWADTSVTFVTKVAIWLWFKVNNTCWFNFELDMDPNDITHISGFWKCHVEDTWLEYTFKDMGTEDYSGTIEINTSANLSLTAYFDFDVDGTGEGWAKFQGIKFVDYTFYAMPPDPYRGYYTLASEGWNVQHEFPKQ